MRTYIWSVPTRLFHWLAFFSLVSAFIIGESEGNLNLHTSFGYMAASLVLFRIIWGFIGPRYSKFTDFPIGFKSIKEFFTNMKESKRRHMGHNPAASLVMLAILVMVVALACSGMLALAAEGAGPLSFLNISPTETFEELHEVFVKILIGLVMLHIIGLITDKLLHGDNGTLFSMFTGYKTKAGESVQLTAIQKAVSVIFLTLPLALFAIGAATQNLASEQNEKNDGIQKINDNDDDD